MAINEITRIKKIPYPYPDIQAHLTGAQFHESAYLKQRI